MTKEVINRINSVIWGMPMIVLILSTGIYFSVKTGFFQFRRCFHILKKTILSVFSGKASKTGDKKSISRLQALYSALAATMGTGNIAGVATAITAGGAGAVFWMWVSAFFGMMTIYAENVLGIYYRKKSENGEWRGGAMYYIYEGLRRRRGFRYAAMPLAVMFSLFCVLASLGMGNMTQSNTIALAAQDSFGISCRLSGIVLTALTALVILGGLKRIARVTEAVIPMMSIVYLVLTGAVIAANFENIGTAFSDIFAGAFGLRAVAGGGAAIAVKNAVSVGLRRGVFSNEAGLGSSVTVHCASDVVEPAEQGMWGIFEVFADTIVMCTLTALAILCSGAAQSGAEGAALVTQAFSCVFPKSAGFLLTACVFLFAFATIIGWSYFGTEAFCYVFGRKSEKVFAIIFILFVYIGAVTQLETVWSVSDIFNGLMALPNLLAITVLSDTVIKITQDYIRRRIYGKNGKASLSAYSALNAYQRGRLFDGEG